MKETILQLIKNVGIFTVIAQLILHFCAGSDYEKYTKVLTSLMLLILLVVPISRVFSENEIEAFSQNLEAEIAEYEKEAAVWREDESENLMTLTESALAKQLDDVALPYGYHVVDTQIAKNESGVLTVTLSRKETRIAGISPVIIGEDEGGTEENCEEIEELKECLAEVLETDKGYLEVMVIE